MGDWCLLSLGGHQRDTTSGEVSQEPAGNWGGGRSPSSQLLTMPAARRQQKWQHICMWHSSGRSANTSAAGTSATDVLPVEPISGGSQVPSMPR